MDLMDRPPPPDLASGEDTTVAACNRTSKRWALAAAILCPCHLWLVAGAVGLLGAGATAEAIRDNQTALVVLLAPLSALALWRAIAAGQRGARMRRDGLSCSPPGR